MLKKYIFVFLALFSVSVNAEDKTLLVLGDSLSAGYGIGIQQGWVFLLQERLLGQGYRYKVINASISGDTTRGARARLDKLLAGVQPGIAIIELGGNDGLRGISIDEMYENFSDIIGKLKTLNTTILLIPMQLPPNYGPVYNGKFMNTYARLATEHDINLGTFILADIADKPELMQGDGIHPVAKAQSKMLDNVWPDLEPLLLKN